jgi:carbon storage regulator CsrA
MLVLTRKVEESVVVGGSEAVQPMLTVTVLAIDGGKVRLGFQADATVVVHRWEVWQRLCTNGVPENPPGSSGPPGAG